MENRKNLKLRVELIITILLISLLISSSISYNFTNAKICENTKDINDEKYIIAIGPIGLKSDEDFKNKCKILENIDDKDTIMLVDILEEIRNDGNVNLTYKI